jgi:hypothetical protein
MSAVLLAGSVGTSLGLTAGIRGAGRQDDECERSEQDPSHGRCPL